MMALLLRREALLPSLQPGVSLHPSFWESPSDVWLGVSLPPNERLGYVNITTTPDLREGDEGVRTNVNANLRLSVLGRDMKVLIAGDAWASRKMGLTEFNVTFRSEGHNTEVQANVLEGVLSGEVETGGESFPFRVPVGTAFVLSSGAGVASFSLPPLEVGQEYFVDTFDPLTLSSGRAKIACVGEETIAVAGERVATKVVTTTLADMTTKAWVSPEGAVVRAELPVGFVLERIRAEDALTGISSTPSQDSLLHLAAITPAGPTPKRGARRMVVELTGTATEKTLPTDETQTRDTEGVFMIQQASTADLFEKTELSEEERMQALAGDPFIQTEHVKIVARAKAIVGRETDVWKRAMLVYEWVYGNVAKEAVLSVPSALDVLNTRRGDCNEHTVLYTALARAAGVPTRIAVGVVWSEEYKAFYYHAWPEVHVGRWIWTDPTLGQPFADATHIKLLNGGLESWWRLVPYFSRLRIRVLSIE
jgi:transglutaminase-like putative cysteine protease